MIKLTKFSLKRPVTLILIIVAILYFGLSSIFSSPMELTPDMNMPMQVIVTVYPGAAPEDINELVTKPIEGAVATMPGIDTVASYSMDNSSLILLQYEYGTDMDSAYLDLRKSLDTVRNSLPDDVTEPTIYQFDINASSAMSIAVMGGSDENLYNYVNDSVVPEIEKLASVADVGISGGQQNYIKVELMPEKMAQYNLNMSTIASLVSAADFTIPAGSVDYGKQELNVSVGSEYKDVEKIKNIVLPLQTGDVIHLSDVANVTNTLKDKTSIARYNGSDVVFLDISKQQSASAVSLSKKVIKTLEEIKTNNATFDYKVVYDSSDLIVSALTSVFETLLIAIALAMIVLFVFFGDWKASLIVGSSIPVSVLLTLTLMSAAGFSLNIISVGSLTLGVGMIVDNSIVVLESCFRKKDTMDYEEAAVDGTKTVMGSIFGGTATTCVVFIPLALLAGLTGQIFKQLGFTIVFCLVSSFFAAIMIVPLLYLWAKPVEKKESYAGRYMAKVQDWYRNLVRWVIPQRKKVIGVTILLFVLSMGMIAMQGMELIPNIDEGQIAITATIKPGMKIDEVDEIAKSLEEYVANQEDVKEYQMTFGSSGVSMMSIGSDSAINLTAYLKSGRKHSTKKLVQMWTEDLTKLDNTTISVESASSMGLTSLSSSSVTVNLKSTDYDLLKKTADEIVEKLHNEPFIEKPHSSQENNASVVKVDVDPVKAEAYGMTPVQIASTVYMNLSGKEVLNYTSNGNEISVMLENPKDYYGSVENLKSMLITTVTGVQVPLEDLAEVYFVDSAKSIGRSNKLYQASITGAIPESYEDSAQSLTEEYIKNYGLPEGVTLYTSPMMEMMEEELGGLLGAIFTAIFLVFIVMAMQFESPRLSLMVMFTIPFSLIGAFGLLFAFNIKLSMVSMMGMLMLVGTVVNNGILYVDTVNQYRQEMPLSEALVEGGATRIRPMLMTTLTTILAMIPLSLGIGQAGQLMQGLALVNIGGLLASTILTLLLLPTIYQMFDERKTIKVKESL